MKSEKRGFSISKTKCPDVLSEKVGIFRNADDLRDAVRVLNDLHARSHEVGTAPGSPRVSPEISAALQLPGMIKLALCMARGALLRTESRGSHFREDHPHRNDRDWLKRTLAFWPAGESAPLLRHEPVAVTELPPEGRTDNMKTRAPNRPHPEEPDAQTIEFLEIFRYDPNRPDRAPFMQPFTLPETAGMTLFTALNRIRESMDPTLMFDFVCRSSVCGSWRHDRKRHQPHGLPNPHVRLVAQYPSAAPPLLQAAGGSLRGYPRMVSRPG